MTRSRAPSARGWPRVAFVLLLAVAAALLHSGSAGGFGYLTEWGDCEITPGDELAGVQSISAASSGNVVFVAERSGAQRVLAFNPRGRLLGILEQPYGDAVDKVSLSATAGTVYVALAGFSLPPEIRRFAFGGGRFAQVAGWGPGGHSSGAYFRHPVAILGGTLSGGAQTGDVVFVQDWSTTDSGGLTIFTSEGLSLGSDIGDSVDGGVALTGISGAKANVIAAEAPLGRPPAVAHFAVEKRQGQDRLGTRLIKRWTIGGSPAGIAYTNGALWVAVLRSGVQGNLIQVFTPDGGLVAQYDESQVPAGLAGLNGIAADNAGNVYLALSSRVVKLGPGGALPPSGGGSDSRPAEECGPDLTLGGRRTQRVLRRGGVVVTAISDDRARFVASGTVSVPGASKVYRLKNAQRRAGADRRTRLELKLTRGARRAIQRAFARTPGGRLRARIRVRATDPAGIRSVTRRTVRLRR
jgi:hypothetical protein